MGSAAVQLVHSMALCVWQRPIDCLWHSTLTASDGACCTPPDGASSKLPVAESDTGWDLVAAEQVPEGLDLAVQKMKKGETAEVTLAPRYAFGAEGAQRPSGTVPPDATVTYTVQLKEFESVSGLCASHLHWASARMKCRSSTRRQAD
jgi:FKBP-type peptidyl-prolyl cis-trans isomerase